MQSASAITLGAVLALAALASSTAVASGATNQHTKVLKWKDGKAAPFYLGFDDSCATHVTKAIPELQKRGMVGVFYINPGNGPYKSKLRDWEQKIPATDMVYANHTFTHKGALSVEHFEDELVKSNATIAACDKKRPESYLVSFGVPGVPKENWRISKEEKFALLTKHNLIERPGFFGYPFHVKNADAMLGIVDKAIATGELRHLTFHGVGGDWLSTPMDIYIKLLDKLEACEDRVWLTDPISWHKYLVERSAAQVRVVRASSREIRIRLACRSDQSLPGQKYIAYTPGLYDMPLTLSSRVPAQWRVCRVKQGRKTAEVRAANGRVQYDAVPGKDEIVITPVRGRR